MPQTQMNGIGRVAHCTMMYKAVPCCRPNHYPFSAAASFKIRPTLCKCVSLAQKNINRHTSRPVAMNF